MGRTFSAGGSCPEFRILPRVSDPAPGLTDPALGLLAFWTLPSNCADTPLLGATAAPLQPAGHLGGPPRSMN